MSVVTRRRCDARTRLTFEREAVDAVRCRQALAQLACDHEARGQRAQIRQYRSRYSRRSSKMVDSSALRLASRAASPPSGRSRSSFASLSSM